MDNIHIQILGGRAYTSRDSQGPVGLPSQMKIGSSDHLFGLAAAAAGSAFSYAFKVELQLFLNFKDKNQCRSICSGNGAFSASSVIRILYSAVTKMFQTGMALG